MRRIICGWMLACAALMATESYGAEADTFRLEPGYTLFFNGKNLTGFKVRGGDDLEGATETAKKRFQVIDDKLVIDGKSKGNMVIDTIKPFAGDVHIKFQYLPSEGCNNDLYIRGVKFDLKKGSVKNIEFGKWNDLDIIVTGSQVEIKNNGETQTTAKASSESGPLGIRAEFGACEYRRLRFQ